MARVTSSVAAALLAIFLWRNGRTLKNSILLADLPAAYFVGGDAQSRCNVIKDGVSHKLKYCEDAVFWQGTKAHQRSLLITCDPHRAQWNTVMGPLRDPTPKGALWVYSPKSKRLSEVALENYPQDADFHPLGVDVFPGPTPNDPSHVLVVNHGRHNSTIEQFRLSSAPPYRARHVRTLTSHHLVSPNAVAFTSPSSFYVTQDHFFTRRLPGLVGKTLPLVETLFLPGLAWVNHMHVGADGQLDVAYAARGIPFPNGIAIAKDEKTVAVASSSQNGIHLYTRSNDHKLKFEETVSLPFVPDNIGFEGDKLIVAGHPNFPAIVSVAAQTGEYAPSWVVSIVRRTEPFNASEAEQEDAKAPYPVSRRVPTSQTHKVETLYQSDGTGFSTSSTGLWDPGSSTLFAVGLYEEGILACKG